MEESKLIPEKNNIRIKEQEGKYVIFNLETSGFHMLEKDAIDILDRVDGKTTIKELANYPISEPSRRFQSRAATGPLILH